MVTLLDTVRGVVSGRRRAALAVVLLAAAAPGFASERVAVLEFTGAAVGDDMRRAITDRARAAALEPSQRFGLTVMTRESTALVVQQMGAQCLEGQCEIELARTIGASYVVTGELRKLENAFYCDLKLHDTEKGALLGVESYKADDPLAVLDRTPVAAERLVASGLGRAIGTEGTLDLDVTDAGARVLLDGAEVARGPVRKSVRAPVGSHRLVVDLEGHATWETAVNVAPRTTTLVAPRLVPLAGGRAGRRTYVEAEVLDSSTFSGGIGPGGGTGLGARIGRRFGRSWAGEVAITRLSEESDTGLQQSSTSGGLAGVWSPRGNRWFALAAELGHERASIEPPSGRLWVESLAPASWYARGELRLDVPLGEALSIVVRTGVTALSTYWEQDVGMLTSIESEYGLVVSDTYATWSARLGIRFAF
jgi:hypothetical protein